MTGDIGDLGRTQGGLGRGLSALIPQRGESLQTVELPISAIERNPYQPRMRRGAVRA